MLTVQRPKDSVWSEVFTVLAGKEETSFTLHKKVFSESSSFFRGALAGGWKESEEGVVRLDHIAPRDFKIYVDYVYGGKLDHEIIDTQFVPGEDTKRGARVHDYRLGYKIHRLCGLWVHGDFLGDTNFQNKVISQLIDDTFDGNEFQAAANINPKTLRLVWDSTPAESKLRLWAMDAMSRSLGLHSWVIFNGNKAPAGFIKWLLVKTLEREDGGLRRAHDQWERSEYYVV